MLRKDLLLWSMNGLLLVLVTIMVLLLLLLLVVIEVLLISLGLIELPFKVIKLLLIWYCFSLPLFFNLDRRLRLSMMLKNSIFNRRWRLHISSTIDYVILLLFYFQFFLSDYFIFRFNFVFQSLFFSDIIFHLLSLIYFFFSLFFVNLLLQYLLISILLSLPFIHLLRTFKS